MKTCNVNTQREMILIYFWAGFAVLQYCDLKSFLVFVYHFKTLSTMSDTLYVKHKNQSGWAVSFAGTLSSQYDKII